MVRQLVVHLRAGGAEVDVLEPVRQRPADVCADRDTRVAGVPDEPELLKEAVPVLRRFGSGLAPDVSVVPHGRLVGGLEPHAVQLAIDRTEVQPRLRIVGLDGRADLVVERDEVAVGGELLHERGLADHGDVGRRATLELAGDVGGAVVAEAGVGDRGAGVLLELCEDGLEVLLLRAGPGGHDVEVAAGEVDGGAGVVGGFGALVGGGGFGRGGLGGGLDGGGVCRLSGIGGGGVAVATGAQQGDAGHAERGERRDALAGSTEHVSPSVSAAAPHERAG